jgi:glucose-6-phosphate 1-dehydrogenase
MPEPLTVVIFGATGDLTARKLVPALYHLYAKKRLPPEARVVGVARSELGDDEFHRRLADMLRSLFPKEWQPERWKDFTRQVSYVAADATAPEGIKVLDRSLREREGSASARRLYYLAVAPKLYPKIATCLGEAGMSADDAGFRRLIVEKPFGTDLASARKLNQVLHEHFREDQIYRIDHYLGKETVQNLVVLRFANSIFEPLWNRRYIDHVQITVMETVKVGHRADYYDRAGVLRDMFQSHLLQLLTLIAMEPPARFAANPLRNEKVKVLESIPVPTAEEAKRLVCLGRYQGYLSEPGVGRASRTPTYAALRLHVDNWRWQDVPFYLRSGKAMSSRSSEVVIHYRTVPHQMFDLPAGVAREGNRLALCIQPDEGIHLDFQSKVPDEGMEMRRTDLSFHFRDVYAEGALPEAYERLLQDALHGDATLFMRSDEIERAWEIMDPIIAAVEQPGGAEPQEYPVGSDGPACADRFLERDGRAWATLCRH